MKKIIKFYRELISRGRLWIYFVVFLSILWTAVGFVTSNTSPESYPKFIAFLDETFSEALGDVEPTDGLDFAFALFRQNITATMSDLFLGVALGIFPVISILFNFFLLGFLGAPAFLPGNFTEEHISSTLFILAIVPHGIFEIPAIVLASAYGLRLGWQWLMPGSAGKRGRVFKEAFFDAVRIFPLIFGLLVIAAFVETFVTGRLIGI